MTEDSESQDARLTAGAIERDLLGDEVRAYRDPRGRKKFKNSNALQEYIAVCAAAGMENKEIADAVGCCDKTLRNRFFSALTKGKAVKRAEAITKLWELGIGGSVPALKAFLALTEKGAAVPPPKAPRPEKLGKKEQAEIDAQSAHQDTGWDALLNPDEMPVH